MTAKTLEGSSAAANAAAPTRCSMGGKSDGGSCFPTATLLDVLTALGETDLPKTRRKMLSRIRSLLNCPTDRCVSGHASLPVALSERLSQALVTLAPVSWRMSPTTWLSNVDIEDKIAEMFRCESRRHCELVGVFPMNAMHAIKGGECVSRELCEYDPVSRRRSKRVAFMVFNTDYHGMPGKHWVCFAAVLDPSDKRYGLYYYDPVGKPPDGDILQITARLKLALDAADGRDVAFDWNDVRNQRSNTECGMFCLAFIHRFSSAGGGNGFRRVVGSMKGDEEMIKLRGVYFEVHGGRAARRPPPGKPPHRRRM